MDTAHQKGERGIDRCNSASPTKLGSLSATHTHTAKAGWLNAAKLGEESFPKRGAAPGNVPSIRPAWHGKTRASTRGPPRQIPGGRQARSGGKLGKASVAAAGNVPRDRCCCQSKKTAGERTAAPSSHNQSLCTRLGKTKRKLQGSANRGSREKRYR